jgi:Fe/S biogenesis protein NfuA
MSVFQTEQMRTEPVLQVSSDAEELIVEARAAEAEPERLALFLEVNGEQNGVYTYDMWFEAIADASPRDSVVELGSISVVVAAQSIDLVRGATLDVGDDGLVMINPNAPAPPPGYRAAPASDLSSPIELAVLEILESQINPQIAAHGGRADLVAVDGGTAFLRLSGGCQGCGMAAVTLSQGISVAIQEALPEIVEIVDVTAHEDGSNPYFEAAKK